MSESTLDGQRALELHDQYREQRRASLGWDAILTLLELREVLREHPRAVEALPPGFDPDLEL
jgi:hypothetical protein